MIDHKWKQIKIEKLDLISEKPFCRIALKDNQKVNSSMEPIATWSTMGQIVCMGEC